MKGFGKLHIKPGVSGRSRYDEKFTHLTTFNFGQVLPVLAMECIGGDRFPEIEARAFSRMSPLAKPTYGDFSLHTLSAFVPYFQLADDYEAWRIGKTTFEGHVPHGRFIPMVEYVTFLRKYVFKVVNPPSGTSADGKGHFVNSSGVIVAKYDFCYTDASGNVVYMVFRDSTGKFMFKVMSCLGYGLPSNVDLQTSSRWYTYYSNPDHFLSAFPFLAFIKLHNDWMSQSQRFNSSFTSSFLSDVRSDRGTTGYNALNHAIQSNGINLLLQAVIVTYENDYFTSAWQYPNRPIAQGETINTFNVPGQNMADSVISQSEDVELIQDVPGNLNYRSVDLLNRVAAYIRRRNYSGSKAVQQVFSELGIKPEDYKSNYSHIIDTSIFPVQVGDVMSMADTSNAILGDYAGKGIVGAEDKFAYNAQDYGMLFYLAWYTVKPLYPYGFDRQVLRNSPLEFYNSEFDGMAADAISYGEICTNPLEIDNTNDFDVFGFTEKYNSYRCLRDKVTGDFLDFHEDGEMNTWHTGRLLQDVRSSGALVAQSVNVNTIWPENEEFLRIFSDQKGDFDHFLTQFQFKIKGVRPIKSLSEVVNLGSGDFVVSRNGNDIS